MPIKFESFPLKLLQKGNALAWNPVDFDFTKDREDWRSFDEAEQTVLLRSIVGFLIGERAVAHDLAPLQQALRCERGRMEEEMYITQQTYEESIHVMFFQNWMDKVLPEGAMTRIVFPSVDPRGTLLSGELPRVMQALSTDKSPEAQLRATITYHMLIEGVLAEAGYQFFYRSLEGRGLLPALTAGIHHIQRDEVRHIAFGLYFLQRLLRDNPELDSVFEAELERLKPITRASAMGFYDRYEGTMPFGLEAEEFELLFEQLWESRYNTVKRGDLIEV